MTFDTTMEVISALDDVLETERAALLSGELEKLALLVPEKESLIDQFSVLEDVNSADVDGLTGKLKRNQDLLDNALAGIREVAGRLAELRRVRAQLDTYDARGAKHTIDIDTDASVEKRA